MGIGTALAVFSLMRSVYLALTPKPKKDSPIYVDNDKEKESSTEEPVAVVYGRNKVKGHMFYREETIDEAYDCAVGFCQGPIESIGEINVDEIQSVKLGADFGITDNSPYLGTADQEADSIFEGGIYTIKATEDAYVDEDNPTIPYGTSVELKTNYSSPEQMFFLKFDLSKLPLGFTITGATLKLWQSDYTGSDPIINIRAASGSWAEDTVTYATKPTPGAYYSSMYTAKRRGGNIAININSTGISALNTAYSAQSTITFTIDQDELASGNSIFSSKEGIATPLLTINFSGGDPCAFRHTAYIAIHINTSNNKINTAMPSLDAIIEGKLIKVWDVATTKWIEEQYTRNPAWQLRDILTNDDFPEPINEDYIDDDTFKAVAVLCDEEITNKDGIDEPRYQCDIVFDESTNKETAVKDILATFGGYLYQRDGKICLGVETAESPPYDHVFDHDSIVDGTFVVSEIDEENIPNMVRVLFIDQENDFEKDHVQAENTIDIERRGIVPKVIPLYGIKRRSQATRMANFILWRGFICNEIASFRVSINNMHACCGDLSQITYDVPGWTLQPARITELKEYPNDEIELTVEKYDASIHNDEGIPDDFNERPQIPRKGLPPNVTSIDLTETYQILEDGTYQPQILVEWTPSAEIYAGGVFFAIFIKPDGGAYGTPFAVFYATEYTFDVPGPGLYYVKIQTVGCTNGIRSDDDTAPEDSITIYGSGPIPVPTYLGFILTTDSRGEWSTGLILYKGVLYEIQAGYTTDEYIFFDPDISITTLQTSASEPSLGANGFFFAFYDSGTDTIEMAQTFRLLNVQCMKAGSITTTKLSFVPVESTNVIGSINASAEGIDIEADNIAIAGTTTFTSGYDPTDKFDLTGNDMDDVIDGTTYGKMRKDWKHGSDVTMIDGGKIYADSITSGIGTFKSGASGQRIVTDGINQKLSFFDSSEREVCIIDDDLLGDGRPGFQVGHADTGGVFYAWGGDSYAKLFDNKLVIMTDTDGADILVLKDEIAAEVFTVDAEGNLTIKAVLDALSVDLTSNINVGGVYKMDNVTIIDSNKNITTSIGTVDGRDIADDGDKLDTIEEDANNYSHPPKTQYVTYIDIGDIRINFNNGGHAWTTLNT